MSKLVQIYNLTSNDIDVAYINVEQISSIEAMDNENITCTLIYCCIGHVVKSPFKI